MKWPCRKLFSFTHRPACRAPLRKARLRMEQLETRLAPSTNVLTYHNDNFSSGQNVTETVLTPANVNSTTFGKLFSTNLDGQVYAQPLYVAGVNITTGTHQGTHNVVFVATQHDSLYAIDALTGTILWHDALLQPVHGGTVTSVPNGDVSSGDISPEIGITSTPVIDSATSLIYVEAKTKETASDGTHYLHQLYAISIDDGTYQLSSPVVIADTISNDLSHYTYVSGPWVNGNGDGRVDNVTTLDGGHTNVDGKIIFNALRQMNRPGLTEANGDIYIAYASHGDNTPYHGWVLGFNTATLALNAVLNTTPNGGLGGIWQGGGRVAVDASGNLYFETGNGSFNNTTPAGTFPTDGDYGDSFVKLSVDTVHNSQNNQNINGWGLKVADFFTPFDQQNLNNGDLDLGSGGLMLLPDSAGNTAHPHLLVGSGKEGRIYLIDETNMGKFDVNTDHVVQETNNTTISGSFDTPAYYNGAIYYVGGSNIGNPNDVGKTFSIAAGQLSSSATSQGPDSFAYPGDTPSISSNGSMNGIVWAVDTGTNQLRAYNATGFNSELYTSAQAAGNRDSFVGSAVKFAVPTVADGEVYVGTSSALVVFGLIQPATQAPAAPSNLLATAVSGSQINLTWVDNSTRPNTANGFDIEDSTDGVNFSQVATASAGTTTYTVGGLQTSRTYTFRMRAFNNIGNSGYSDNASATTTNQAPTLDFSNGFAGSATLLTFNGKTQVNGTALELTDGGFSEAASAFSTNKVNVASFSTQFGFQILSGTNPTADGFTFTIQGVGNTALGSGGGSLGYQGIGTSVAIKFDLYNNSGEGVDSTGLYTNGAAPTNVGSIDLTGTGIDLHSQDPFNVFMLYDGTTLKVTITDTSTGASAAQSYPIDIPGTVGSSTAYVGFTGGTGGLSAIQNILTWTYTPGTTTPPAAPTNLMATAASGTEVDLSWTNHATNQTGFKIDRATDSGFTQNLLTQTTGASATTFIDGGLTPGATYYYRVRANNPAGDSNNSNSRSVTLPVPPTAPINLQAVKITTSEVDLTWTNTASNATGIEVFRQKGNNTFIHIADLAATATSLNDTGLVTALAAGTVYTYDVEAINLAGPSGPASVTVTTVTLAPTNLMATGGIGQVKLNWTAPTGAATYNVYRSTTTGTETLLTTGVTAPTFTDTGLANGTVYFYLVTAVDPGGESARSGEASATTAPAAPSGLQATGTPANTGVAQVKLTWTATAGAATYNVYRSLNGNGEGGTPIATGVSATTYTDTTIAFGTTYFYKVTAVDTGGEGPLSNEASATPLLLVRINFTGDATQVLPSYLNDVGQVSGARVNGLTFGWNQDNTANMVDRDSSTSPNELRDTFAEMQASGNPNASWSLAVPNGTYSVHVMVGDPNSINSVYKVNVEGVPAINFTPTSTRHWADSTITVAVTNGLLTVTNAAGAVNDNIDALTVTQGLPSVNLLGGFGSSAGTLTVNGSTQIKGNKLQLTDGNTNEAGSAFTKVALDVAKFSTQFNFQLTNPNADGFAFVIQGMGANALGANGGGLGYAGINNSVALKFDLFDNAGEGSNSTGVYLNGASPTVPAVDLTGSGIDLHSGHVFKVALTYDGSTLAETITDLTTKASVIETYTVDIVAALGGQAGYVGFTGGTSGQTATQSILSWKFTPAA
jgi:fibronectin type 3 domain-containing protein